MDLMLVALSVTGFALVVFAGLVGICRRLDRIESLIDQLSHDTWRLHDVKPSLRHTIAGRFDAARRPLAREE